MHGIGITQEAQQRYAGSLAPSTEPRDPELIEMGKVMAYQQERLNDLLARLTQFADRLLGNLPQEANAVGPSPVPNGIIDELRQRQAWVGGVIDALMEQESRLGRIG